MAVKVEDHHLDTELLAGAGRGPPEQEKMPAPEAMDGDNAEKKTEEEPTPAVSVWPPSQRAREAVTQSLAESLSSPSGLFQRYGAVPLEEAVAAAHRIEQEAFAAVSPPAATAKDDDGMEALNAYSKEISKRVVDFCKARRSAAASEETPSPPSEASQA